MIKHELVTGLLAFAVGVGCGLLSPQMLGSTSASPSTSTPQAVAAPLMTSAVKPVVEVTSPIGKPLYAMWDAAQAQAGHAFVPTLDEVSHFCTTLNGLVHASSRAYIEGSTPAELHDIVASGDTAPELVAVMDSVVADLVAHPKRTATSQSAISNQQCQKAAANWHELHRA